MNINAPPFVHSSPINTTPTRKRRWRTMTIGLWNVRGMNDLKKKQYLQWMTADIGADVVMFNETKLTSACVLHGLHSHQTLDIRKGGCATFTRTHLHRKVKAVGNYLLWSRVPLGSE
jgi:hypothetical protein